MHRRERHFKYARFDHQLSISIVNEQLEHCARLFGLCAWLRFVHSATAVIVIVEKEKIVIDEAKTRRQTVRDPHA